MSVSRPGLAVDHRAVQGRRAAHRGAGAAVRHRAMPTPTGCRKGLGVAGAADQAQGHRRRAHRHADAVQQERDERRLRPGARRAQRRGRSEAGGGHARGRHDRRAGPRGAGRDRSGAHGRRRRDRWPTCAQALQSANLGLPVGELLGGNRAVAVESGPFLQGCARGRPNWWSACATASRSSCRTWPRVRDGPLPRQRYVWHGVAGKDGGELSGRHDRDHQEAGRERHRRGQRGDAARRRVAQHRHPARHRGGGDAQLRRHRQRQGAEADPEAAVRHRVGRGAGVPGARPARGRDRRHAR